MKQGTMNRQAAAIAENRLKYENADFAEQCKTKERVIKKQMKKRSEEHTSELQSR